MSMTPKRPYLLRAYYEWMLDNNLTPHLVVNAEAKGTKVPRQYVKDGQIVLNIATSAVIDLELTNNKVEFNASFGNVSQQVVLPMASIIAIYARENTAGVAFEAEPAYDILVDEEQGEETLEQTQDTAESKDEQAPSKKGASHLKVIK